jgi:rhodanese-related sulfurtransferase
MMRRKAWLLTTALAALLLAVAACGRAPVAKGSSDKNPDGYVDITVDQLAEMMKAKDFTLVNVHVPYEGEIEQTDLHIPFDQVADYLGELPDKEAAIVLYCRSGSMSTTAAKALVELGYTNVMELDGGFSAWDAAGHELLTRPDSSASGGSASSPRIFFDRETIDMGDLKVEQAYTAQFDYHNLGSAPLIVEEKVSTVTKAGC